ncbi:hypothetical protein Pcinc_036496 [Petrolisthes cinctipes]|uniref:Uncharacterized protein n=1 Tax=Petrolisthes cinctipes TaxID=88211 RepID=A0AAE1BUU6_PETCI|nr:hypothetical protein Pcinc_036496 [Petrolisthes cinctipes]
MPQHLPESRDQNMDYSEADWKLKKTRGKESSSKRTYGFKKHLIHYKDKRHAEVDNTFNIIGYRRLKKNPEDGFKKAELRRRIKEAFDPITRKRDPGWVNWGCELKMKNRLNSYIYGIYFPEFVNVDPDWGRIRYTRSTVL